MQEGKKSLRKAKYDAEVGVSNNHKHTKVSDEKAQRGSNNSKSHVMRVPGSEHFAQTHKTQVAVDGACLMTVAVEARIIPQAMDKPRGDGCGERQDRSITKPDDGLRQMFFR
jgi:hypothetical protein